MSETIQNIPQAANNHQTPKSELEAHFESQIEAQYQGRDQTQEPLGFLQNIFPSIFMTPQEIIHHLEQTRGRVEEIEKQAA